MSDLAQRIANLTPKQRALLELRRSQSADVQPASEPIAVIGIGCRFPGGVTGPDSFWTLLREGRDAITEVPADRWDIDALYDPDPEAPGKMYTRWGGFLSGVDQFDARFFGITPREAASMDPQQRLLLEVAWEALEHAGQPPDRLVGTTTGVFIGMMTNDYSQLSLVGHDPATMDVYSGSGVDYSFAAGRLSYVLGLQGPSMVIATACSSSLVAAHLACQSLRSGESQLALAGGVSLILAPEATLYSCRIRSMAADGRCKTFDAAADGYVRGEGCGIVVLKRLANAVRDGDRILALIRGSAVNHDGKSAGLTVPNAAAQQAVIRTALANGGVQPNQIGYVEAHGTGTPLGDPIELRSLWSVVGQRRAADRTLLVGSVKTNVGHLEAAAGAAGLIKTVLALQHREIPAHLHLQTPSPYIEWDAMRVEVPRAIAPWPADNIPAIAGVSSFGLSGMNAHVVVEEAPRVGREDEADGWTGPLVLPLSARTAEALRAVAEGYRGVLDEAGPALRALCYTAAVRRSHLEERVALVGENVAELRAGLEAFLARGPRGPRAGSGRPKVAFVFPGQGSQHAGMTRGLLAGDAVFRGAVEACDAACRAEGPWRVLEWLEQGTEWTAIERVQPALFAVQVGLAAVWAAWGIRPDGVIGHSMGEVAAAHVAGILSLADAAQIICRRSALLAGLGGGGGMLVVELSRAATLQLLAGRAGLEVAASNGPRTTVVAGAAAAIEALAAAVTAAGVFCRPVQVDVAAHSAQVAPLEDALTQALAGVTGQAGTVPLYSTVTGGVCAGAACGGDYWVRNLRQPVQFWEALQALAGDGHRVFVELSPHPVLGPAIADGLQALAVAGEVRASLRRGEDERRVLCETLGALYEQGQRVTWPAFYPGGGRVVDLPTYPWQRHRFWIAPPDPNRRGHHDGGAALPGEHHEFSGQPGTHVWDLELGADKQTYLADHRIEGVVVVPAALYLEMAVAASADLWSAAAPELEQVRFKQVLRLPETGHSAVQLIVHRDSGSLATFQIASRSDQAGGWTVHVDGKIRTDAPREASVAPTVERAPDSVEVVQARCRQSITGQDFYAAMAARGLDYGPAFQVVIELWRRDGEALARLRAPGVAVAGMPHGLHPTVLDACFQCVGAALSAGADGGTSPAVPIGLGRLRVLKRADGDLWAYARVMPNSDSIEAEVLLLDADGDIVAEMTGFRVQPLERGPQGRAAFADWLFDVRWHAAPRPDTETSAVDRRAGPWLVFADRQGVGEALAESLTRGGDACIVVAAGSAYTESSPNRYELDPLDLPGFRQLLARAGTPAGVVHLWGLDLAAPLASAQVPVCMSVVHLVQALSTAGWRDLPRLWLVTRGSQSVHEDDCLDAPEQATLWGLGRTIAMEHPELACTRIDLGAADLSGAAATLCAEIHHADREDQIALRGDARYVARLARWGPEAAAREIAATAANDQPFRLEIDAPGILDRLTLQASQRRAVGAAQVEIEVDAAGLNFLDVLSAMGVRPDAVRGPIALGGECAGTVVAVGAEVRDLEVGDAVMALAPFCFGTHVTTDAQLVVRRPDCLSVEQAASIPVAFLTAYYALIHLGRLGSGESILIHSASGGTGLAAVQLAQRAGAGVYATAGSAEKRAFLRSLGIQHVLDSRSLSFADDILRLTDGRGVDVVLNSLAGEAIARGLAVLAPYGRFLEIGEKDIYQDTRIGLAPFQKNLSYFAVDLARMIVERPVFVRRLLSDLVQQFADGTLRPLPVHAQPIAEAVTGFHAMAQARHTGKIVFTLADKRNTPIHRDADQPITIDSARTVVITGGLGGLGLLVAEWLVERGARHLLLIGRRPPTESTAARLAALQSAGVTVVVAQADIAERGQLAAVLAQPGLPPLGGVIHAAAVLEDSTLERLDSGRLDRVMRPKVDGAWFLHELTLDEDLDFFVSFSSAASVMGSPGQSNYSAANAYLDALAHYRRSRGKPALSINWGPWAETGLAAAQANRGERLAAQGMASIPPVAGLRILDHLLSQNPVQVAVMPLNVRHWRQLFPRAMRAPFLEQLLESSDDAGRGLPADYPVRVALQAAMPPLRPSMLETHLTEQISQVLRIPPAELGRDMPLPTLGLDSLMALELRNRLELSLGVALSATLIWGQPTIAALAPFLLEKMGLAAGAVVEPDSGPSDADSSALAAVASLSDDAAAAMLSERLASLDAEYQ